MTASEKRGTTATWTRAVASFPVSAACHLSISAVVSRIASSSLVINAAADAGPVVWIPRPETMRRPRRSVSVNNASWACGKAEPNTIAAVVPTAIRRLQNSAAALSANSGSAKRDSEGNMQEFSHSSSCPPPYASPL